jgi:RNA polymerase sigma-70 factor (ECF subfamily)
VNYSGISTEELIRDCLGGNDESAWVEFVRRFQPLIVSVALRVSKQWGETSPGLIDDLVQETYLKLCSGGLGGFKSDHTDAVYGYIKVFTANLVHDHLKAVRSRKRGGLSRTVPVESVELGSAPNAPFEAASIERNLLIQQVNSCLCAAVSGPTADRDRRIFWLYYRAGLTASAIAALPSIGLSTKGVESIILRLSRVVKQQFALRKQRGSSSSTTRPIEGIRPSESF